jgi:hypothetical protein
LQVWASKWNDRAWLGRRAAGVPDDQLRMGVLLQQVLLFAACELCAMLLQI